MPPSPHQQARAAEVARNDAAILEAGRRAFARAGVHTSVAAIAETAGVGIATLYRRYHSKTALFETLLRLSNEQWLAAVQRGLAHPDPWHGLTTLITESAEYGQGTLAPLGALGVNLDPSADASRRADRDFAKLVRRAHQSGKLRDEITSTDLILLIEQLGRSPLVEQIADLNDSPLAERARAARRRLISIAIAGIAARGPEPLHSAPGLDSLLAARWKVGGLH